MNALIWITLIAMFLVVYHHALYPLLLKLLSKGNKQTEAASPVSVVRNYHRSEADARLPTIQLLIPAYNEQDYIAAKLINLTTLDYPDDRLSIKVICDGCSDNTAAVARACLAELSFCSFDIEICEQTDNQGKVAVLNQHIRQSQADIVALSDVSALISVDAMLIAASHFSQAEVGVVCGYYHLLSPGSVGEQAYWRYQREVKRCEADMGAPLGAHGAFYLIRKSLFRAMPEDTINDDFVIPMDIVAQGYRAVYEPNIRALELEHASDNQDRSRRKRIGAGNLQQLIRLRHMLLPRFRGVAFTFFSGKALRVTIPVFLLTSLFGSMLLGVQAPLFAVLFLLQLVAYVLAMLPRVLPRLVWPRAIASLNYLVEGHFSSMLGCLEYLAKKVRRQYLLRFVSPTVMVGKRAFDIIGSSILLVVFSPLFPLVALAIKLDSKGPIFYQQTRVGLISDKVVQLFEIYKFRSMRADAEKNSGAVWASKRDDRTTRVGRFLRKTRIDELPQLINVLKGEMSLVGPRPERPVFYHSLEQAIPYYSERTVGLKPGITGLAQVNLAYDSSIEDVKQKLAYDHCYALSLSQCGTWLYQDLSVLLKTVWVVVAGKGQ
ncbi:sugar transferase [Agarivorans sp. TSD2052]|uniref:sugar transferase n=1 Tax=Agarivorans sp. TSD2052 TaxID=2937286 RepID=UPI00200D8618|nr:sugar transferase [Agarivorans sp. TSD2052]UPW16997.1 sugar transferase [Agarivorans sp. TSD2052]